jgi:tetratricopeptide (TPR) repeat protein
MAFLKKLFGKDPAALRKDAEAAAKAGSWGEAKLAWQQLLEARGDAPRDERDEIGRRIGECQTELVRSQLAQVKRLQAAGDLEAATELCRSTIEMADGLTIKAEVKALSDSLTEELTRVSQPDTGAPTEEDVFLALSGGWSETQADELYGYGEIFKKAFLGLHEGRADEARDVFRVILRENPEALHIRLELARALVASRRRETPEKEPEGDAAKAEAKAALEEAAGLFRGYLEREPEEASDELYATVQSELAQVLMDLGDAKGAEECLVEAADVTHEQTYGHLNLGRFLRMEKRYPEAIKRLEIAVEKMGVVTPDIRVYRELGYAHRDAGHRDEALECFKAVIDHQASLGIFDFDPETAEALAALHLERGEKSEAADLYRHLAQGRNLAGRYRYHLLAGKLLKEVGKKAEGVRELHAARALAPDDEARAEVEAALGGKG